MKLKTIFVSILILFVALTAFLFGAVFRLKNQTVIHRGEISVTLEDVLNAAKLENGSSIFFINKEQATNNIEKEIPTIKVVQINTVGLRSIEIVVRERYKTYYTQVGNLYYLMDEDLKVLEITENQDSIQNLININQTEENKLLSINESTNVSDFVGGENQKIFYELFISLYKTSTKTVDGQTQYLTRQEVLDRFDNVTLCEGNTLAENYKRLIIETEAGVKFDISKAEDNLLEKVNKCVSAYESGKYDITKGIIKIFYHADGTEDFDYFI